MKLIIEILFYLCATLVAIIYSQLRVEESILFIIPFFILCYILFDWANMKTSKYMEGLVE